MVATLRGSTKSSSHGSPPRPVSSARPARPDYSDGDGSVHRVAGTPWPLHRKAPLTNPDGGPVVPTATATARVFH